MESKAQEDRSSLEVECLKQPDQAVVPDPRSAICGVQNIEEQHNRIEPYQLHSHVPAHIRQHYEVARNLYLYAFYQYRFYMVAQHHLLVTLEYAIKECVGKKKIQRFGEKREVGKNLKACLVYICEKGLIQDQDFLIWNKRREMKALETYREQKVAEMIEKGLNEIELDYDEVDVKSFPFEFDYLSVLTEYFPEIRNEHGHGTSMLHNHVLSDFRSVSTIINKVYERYGSD